MTLLNKILLILLGIVVVGAFGFIIYQQHEMTAMQTQLNTAITAQQTLLDGITRSSAQYVTKSDLDAFAAQNNVNLSVIQKDVEKLSATISGVNNVDVNSVGQNQSNLPSTTSTTNPIAKPVSNTVSCNGQQIPCPNADPYGYQSTQQTLALFEPFAAQPATTTPATTAASPTQVPIGTVGFSAADQAPWNVNIYPRSYDITNVLATDVNGKQTVYNQVSITTNGKSYTLPISTAKLEQQLPTSSFSFFNPHLFLTAGGGVDVSKLPVLGSANVGATLGIMSWGQTKANPTISVLQIGAGYETGTSKPAAILNPISFNVGAIFPKGIVNNTYVGPSIQVDTGGNVFAGANVSVGF